jgi:hypothetical protein
MGEALEAQLREAARVHLCGGSLDERPLAEEEWSAIERFELDQGSGLA